MRTLLTLAAASTAVLGLAACGDNAGKAPAAKSGAASASRNAPWAAGSSTVFPFASRVAENTARTSGGAPAKIESLGTGGGIKLFCAGTGSAYPDIANASRPMKKSEFEQCAANGVKDIIEIKVGYDGVVIATARSGADFNVSLENIHDALAAELPEGSGFVPNKKTKWSEVAAGLPGTRIQVYGPPPTSGTRDAFVELALDAGAAKNPTLKALKASNEDEFKKRAGTLRSDGAWIDAGENDNAIIGTLTKTPGAVGVFGYSFLDNSRDQVKAISIGGVQPTIATIADGSYPLSRSLFIYVKKSNLDVTPGLKAFVNDFISDAASGKGGYLQDRGLIPLTDAERAAQKKVVADQTPMAAPAK
ncbi:substrate-binding domain-containing protein [Caulobacter mirabilis]|uniref:Phosphate ABC transporter substrate-binding protein n=1 Tax=Caulobacter mirabilis TaxID=69666 RepID=A0A2D2B2B7_9CAUL|nr:substrate-binding domain-containing protein [Caulobacter mirabilis]ATQ44392.1 phosphate ABC transporter substrate-binding protein [Caulobacter mirabilis]